MKILVISRTAWKQNNSFGNTYNNIFGKMRDVSIANIYLADGVPDADNPNVTAYYQVSERQVVKSCLQRKCAGNSVGTKVELVESVSASPQNSEGYDKALQGMKKNRWSGFFIAREIAWKFGNVNWDGVLDFAKEFDPDIIFLPFYYAMYVDRVALFLKKHINVPLVLEASIDIYSMKQLSFDPFFWINRLLIRSYIRKTVKQAEKMYVISDMMKKDYEEYLHIDCGILYKFPDSTRKLSEYRRERDKLQFLYTGNIGSGRWKALALIGNVLKESGVGELVIYTPTPLTNKMKRQLCNCVMNEPVTPDQVVLLQNAADVLVHTESFDLKDKLEVRYSISTKVMDYISAERCIFAVGPADIASIKFLRDNDLALVATDENMIRNVILELGNNKDLCSGYALNSHRYVTRMAEVEPPQEVLCSDLKKIVEDYRSRKQS